MSKWLYQMYLDRAYFNKFFFDSIINKLVNFFHNRNLKPEITYKCFATSRATSKAI